MAENPRIVLVTRRTRLEDLTARYNTREQARFYIEHLGADFDDYEREHVTYQAALRATADMLGRFGRVQRLDREFLPSFLFPPDALVAVLGQDGLVANTLKYLHGQPVIGLNPDPDRWDGVLLPFRPDELSRLMPDVVGERRGCREITFAEAQLSDGQTLLAVNDLFVGPKSHVSARYEIAIGGQRERQSSSGVIVSTGLGSTGWLRSLITGAAGIVGGHPPGAGATLAADVLPWDSAELIYTVREPFPSRSSQATLVFGRIPRNSQLQIRSQMAGNGVIFSDGIEADFVEFNAGVTATIAAAKRCGRLFV